MSDSTNLKETLFIHKQKINLIPQFFLEILHYEESCNLISLILIDNFRTRISQDIGFAMESQEFKGISFCIVFRKNKRQHLKKKEAKNTVFGPFLPKFGQEEISTKIGLRHFLASIVS